jgi:hypothetical protein
VTLTHGYLSRLQTISTGLTYDDLVERGIFVWVTRVPLAESTGHGDTFDDPRTWFVKPEAGSF